jgi:hypothetical protein
MYYNDVMRQHWDKWNIYYLDVTQRFGCGGDAGQTRPEQLKFAEVAGAIGKGARPVPALGTLGCAHDGSFVVFDGRDFLSQRRTFAHELSHAIFRIADEYTCMDDNALAARTARYESVPFANIFSGEASCLSKSAAPAMCRPLENCFYGTVPWYHADPHGDLMDRGETSFQYGPDCARNPRHFLELAR